MLYNKLVHYWSPFAVPIQCCHIKLGSQIFYPFLSQLILEPFTPILIQILTLWSTFLISANDVDTWHQKVIKISSSKVIFYVKNHSNHDDFLSTLCQVTITGIKKNPTKLISEQKWTKHQMCGVKCHNHDFVIHYEVRQINIIPGKVVKE